MSIKQDMIRVDKKLSSLKTELSDLRGERKSLIKSLEDHGVVNVRSARSLAATLKKKRSKLRKKQKLSKQMIEDALAEFDVVNR